MGKIEIQKFELKQGQELNEFIHQVIKSLAQQRKQLNQSLSLQGIYKDYVITRDIESGKFFKLAMDLSLDAIKLGDAVEVKQVFVPVTPAVEKSAEEMGDVSKQEITRSSECDYIDEPEVSLWEGVF